MINETATLLFNKGFKIGSNIFANHFQKLMVKMQYLREIICEKIAQESQNEYCIVCDRGMIDSSAYTTQEKYNKFLENINLDRNEKKLIN